MNREVLDTLPITNASNVLRSGGRVIDIYFFINNEQFSLRMLNEGNGYATGNVFHEPATFSCPFCANEMDRSDFYCKTLTRHRQALFRQLIEHPSIRLEWLYIPYEDSDVYNESI